MKQVIVIGSGLGSLGSAALMAKHRYKVTILEQNWIPGGCATSYPRKGFVFETGATTLVGMEKNMPVGYLFDYLNIQISLRKLDIPMSVLINQDRIYRYEDINKWIIEAESHFGPNQAKFWQEAYKISQFVWSRSLKYLNFPPRTIRDYFHLLKKISLDDFQPLKNAFKSTRHVMKEYGVDTPKFIKFVDEQLMITAQNSSEEVNFLFGAAALCYTNYPNYYIDGGLRNLVEPLINYIVDHHGSILYRDPVIKIEQSHGQYKVTTKNNTYIADKVISGIPINNTADLFNYAKKKRHYFFGSDKLNSAFQMGIVFKKTRDFVCLHHQIHLQTPLPGIKSKSIFVSLSHPNDHLRSKDPYVVIASVSTHWNNPSSILLDQNILEQEIIGLLIEKGFFDIGDLIYLHSSGPRSWIKWTGRKWGFVGGYPQYMDIKPWKLNETRFHDKGIYQTGDTVYPGQGIPGVILGGISTAKKLLEDDGQSVDF
jgi:phytoene dehydrogenase-like protein